MSNIKAQINFFFSFWNLSSKFRSRSNSSEYWLAFMWIPIDVNYLDFSKDLIFGCFFESVSLVCAPIRAISWKHFPQIKSSSFLLDATANSPLQTNAKTRFLTAAPHAFTRLCERAHRTTPVFFVDCPQFQDGTAPIMIIKAAFLPCHHGIKTPQLNWPMDWLGY